ncbi:MAG: restriction endonuclease [Fimbriimonadaceae bacterium]|nr:restriction endonuclease [Fimbriimonadaceae bacterium]
MAIWLLRAGRYGEHEAKFLADNRGYLTWGDYAEDVGKMMSKDDLKKSLLAHFQWKEAGRLIQNANQVWAFAHGFQIDDIAAMPSKFAPVIHFGRVAGPYQPNPTGPEPYFHYRDIEWKWRDVPRSKIDQDLLHSLGAFSTICRISRNDAENRIRKLLTQPVESLPEAFPADEIGPEDLTNLEESSLDQIRQRLYAKFAGHKMAVLVEEILKAQSYTVYRSPEGADKGVDLLACQGPLGFQEPRIAVQVKSQSSPVEHAVVQHLKGAMNDVGATHGLLIAWGGFKGSFEDERRKSFFRIRLWDSDKVIREMLAVYDQLPESIRAEIPLKRVWVLAEEAGGV